MHWTLCESSIFSCARNSEIIAAVVVSSWMVCDGVSLGVQKSKFANFDVVVALTKVSGFNGECRRI